MGVDEGHRGGFLRGTLRGVVGLMDDGRWGVIEEEKKEEEEEEAC